MQRDKGKDLCFGEGVRWEVCVLLRVTSPWVQSPPETPELSQQCASLKLCLCVCVVDIVTHVTSHVGPEFLLIVSAYFFCETGSLTEPGVCHFS